MAAGVPRGPELGARLRAVRDAVLDGRVGDDRAAQLAVALGAASPRVRVGRRPPRDARLGDAHVLFTTRHGGVSEGPFASLNLGERTGDDPAAVAANHARLRELAGGTTLARCSQVHGREVVRRTTPPDGERPQADGIATNVAGVGAARPDRRLPAGGAQRPGRGGDGARGLARPRGRRARRGRRGAARRRRDRPRRRRDRARRRRLLLRGRRRGARGVRRRARGDRSGATSTSRRSRRPGCARRASRRSTTAALCTMCDARFFSHRRDHGTTGRQGGVAWLTVGRRASGSPRPPRAPGGDPGDVEIVAATKYVALEDLGALADAASRGWARTARRTSRPSTPSTAIASRGTSSATCRAARSRRSCRSCSGSTPSAATPCSSRLERHMDLARPGSRSSSRSTSRGRRARAASTPTSSARSSSAARSHRWAS